MEIRAEKPEDIDAIREANTVAFKRKGEAELVDRLRDSVPTISLVALEAKQIIGHVLFSPVKIDGAPEGNETLQDKTPKVHRQQSEGIFAVGLAPIAVRPDYQRQGIGSELIRQGLQECANQGIKAIFVLGDSAYYSRFGFKPAKVKGLKCEYSVPDDAFMALELQENGLADCAGTVKYSAAFAQLK